MSWCAAVILWLLYFPQAFGGYLTLKMLSATDRLFKCAAVMAPITDFRLYSESLAGPPCGQYVNMVQSLCCVSAVCKCGVMLVLCVNGVKTRCSSVLRVRVV